MGTKGDDGAPAADGALINKAIRFFLWAMVVWILFCCVVFGAALWLLDDDTMSFRLKCIVSAASAVGAAFIVWIIWYARRDPSAAGGGSGFLVASQWAWASLLVVVGLGLGTWVLYNLTVEMQPSAKGRNPLPAIALSLGALLLGVKKMLALRRGRREADAAREIAPEG